VGRLVGLGAWRIEVGQGERWVVLADPEGNEFACWARWAERPATGSSLVNLRAYVHE
jgi:hypothetical protein